MIRPGTNYYFAIFRIVKGNAVCNILYLRPGNCFHVLMKSFLLTPLMSESPISSVVFPYNSQYLFDVFVVSDATSDFSRVFSPLGVSHSSFFVAHWLDRSVHLSQCGHMFAEGVQGCSDMSDLLRNESACDTRPYSDGCVFFVSHAVGVVRSRTYTALNHIGLAAVSFRLVFI